MAKQVITVLTDDLDGGKADRTVEFALDGVTYTIDLSERNATKLRKALDPYVNAGTRLGRIGQAGTRRAGGVGSGGDQNSTIRQWAARHGHAVAKRGRIPAAVVAAYRAAH